MKHRSGIFTVIVAVGFLLSCQKPTDPVLDNVYDRQSPNFIASATLQTSTVSNIGANQAQSGGRFSTTYGSQVTAKGVCWSTQESPTTAGTCTNNGTGFGEFTSQMTGLLPSTTYFVRAYATNRDGTTYGNQTSFTTATLPTVTTGSITNITSNGAVVSGNVTSAGSEAVTERGICFATTQNPTTADTCVASGSGTGEFTANLTGLSANTLYYVRAYATSAIGTSYGNETSFSTLTLPTVTTGAITNITPSSATATGTVTDSGSSNVSTRGFCYSLNQNPSRLDPTTTTTCVASGSGTGEFTAAFTNLLANRLYYVRAYAVNSGGTSYGNQMSFTTTSPPAVTTVMIISVSFNSALTAGNVTNEGTTPVISRGICVATRTNPTLSDTCVDAGSGLGEFTAELTGLTPDKVYYIRAFATNSEGTGYGFVREFTTLSFPLDTETVIVNVTNPATGRVWMDRNLGASRAATSSIDTESYGDLYQWGRIRDGHQLRTSAVRVSTSSTDNPGHRDFISSLTDWRNPRNDTLWQGVDGINNPCPEGYRLPTEAEWFSESSRWSSTTSAGAFASPLKLPVAGSRNSGGGIQEVGSLGNYWSSSFSGSSGRVLLFGSTNGAMASRSRAQGNSVRCIRD